MEQFSGSFTVMLVSVSQLISTATLKNNFGLQQNRTNLTCSSTTSTNPMPADVEYAILILKGTLCVCVCVCGCVQWGHG